MTNPPVWLGTTELAYFQVNSTPGSCQHPSRWLRQAGWLAAGPPVPSRPASPPISALKRSMSRLGSATSWRGRGGEAGPAPDVRHQPPGKTVWLYLNWDLVDINAASKVVKAAGCYAWGPGFKPHPRNLFAFLGSVHRHMKLYISRMYIVYTLHKHVLNKYVHENVQYNVCFIYTCM